MSDEEVSMFPGCKEDWPADNSGLKPELENEQ